MEYTQSEKLLEFMKRILVVQERQAVALEKILALITPPVIEQLPEEQLTEEQAAEQRKFLNSIRAAGFDEDEILSIIRDAEAEGIPVPPGTYSGLGLEPMLRNEPDETVFDAPQPQPQPKVQTQTQDQEPSTEDDIRVARSTLKGQE